MKDISATNSRIARNVIYPKKRPSPNGISKSHKTPSSYNAGRRTPFCARLALIQQRQHEAQILAFRQQGILLEDEYRDDIRFYMHEMERFTTSSTQSMDQQPEIKWHMRPCLVDFLVEIHFTFRLRPETLYLTLNIVDRYVSRRIVYVKHYQLVGCAALWIAAKFEDAKERVPTVQELAHFCRETYDESAFVQMEGHVLSTIQWTLGHPTAECWLRIMCYDPCVEEEKVQHVARFLMEITLFYREFINYSASSIALGALTLSRFLCDKGRRFLEETKDCLEIVEYLDSRLATSVDDLSEILVKKYSYAFYSKAATFVVQYYLEGGRFVRHPVITFPSTSNHPSTPTSSSTMISDDMPLKRNSSFCSSDSVSYSSIAEDNKENLRRTSEMQGSKRQVDMLSQKHHSPDFVAFGRTALHNINGSPRSAIFSQSLP
ncbi:hypothetical protein SERLA73DRAFT_173844 [Serpula lacrymans var. lacrymans S7.3]|uniref:Uncharacterized protein n=2 Tax=Serpula lacrymans var. lacrymans TaxID=341189 RepID=F8PHS4_SERL3|nr:uncharacterized protein SERLADRAFT_454749 [Serpula lacrymans var. lacrymans S7.9]EGO04553.1 hypothetical protein SERLA73DRAFT_173844 [Serpula lacrymans var. lacrymans S7.3]EGO30433.1 hypothetical protein SERLADRAFT_454749 [Serpula lacrymans var. lacrymans S7.9]